MVLYVCYKDRWPDDVFVRTLPAIENVGSAIGGAVGSEEVDIKKLDVRGEGKTRKEWSWQTAMLKIYKGSRNELRSRVKVWGLRD
jgi:hypothetical protein